MHLIFKITLGNNKYYARRVGRAPQATCCPPWGIADKGNLLRVGDIAQGGQRIAYAVRPTPRFAIIFFWREYAKLNA